LEFDGMAATPTGNGTVTVACKLPHGVWLRVFKTEDWDEPVMGGGYRKTTRAVELAEHRVLIGGVAAPFGMSPASPMSFGYALTHNVPAQVWEKWVEDNRDSDIVRKKLIFAFAKDADVIAATREHETVKSGLEPLDPHNLPREFQAKRTGVGQLEKSTPGAG
jgi:hypothetical protein